MDERRIQSNRRIVPQSYAGDATYESQIDTEKDRDHRAVLERNVALNKESDESKDGLYKGRAGYKNYIQKDEAQIGMNKFTGYVGPTYQCDELQHSRAYSGANVVESHLPGRLSARCVQGLQGDGLLWLRRSAQYWTFLLE